MTSNDSPNDLPNVAGDIRRVSPAQRRIDASDSNRIETDDPARRAKHVARDVAQELFTDDLCFRTRHVVQRSPREEKGSNIGLAELWIRR